MTVPTCVIYNPAAGRGRAESLIAEVRPSFGPEVELYPTERAGQAEDLAARACERGFARVVAAGGDGTVHEVANGVLRAGRPGVIFSTWPLGSANDYAYTLGFSEWWRRRRENLPTETLVADVGRIRSGDKERFYVNSLGVGFNGMVTVEARKIRRLRGLPLYTLAFLKAGAKHFATPSMSIRFDGEECDGPTLALTINVAQREGGFPLTPEASLTDGKFDYLHARNLRRWHLVRYLPAMARGRLPAGHPRFKLGQCRRVELRSETPLCVHADGEFFSVPEDGLTTLTVEVVPAALTVEIYPPALYGGRGQQRGN